MVNRGLNAAFIHQGLASRMLYVFFESEFKRYEQTTNLIYRRLFDSSAKILCFLSFVMKYFLALRWTVTSFKRHSITFRITASFISRVQARYRCIKECSNLKFKYILFWH